MSLTKNILTGEVTTPIEKFTWLKTTGNPCSGYCCGNPRKHFKDKTVQEKKAELTFKEELNDVEDAKEIAA